MAKTNGKEAGGWLISAGTVGKGVKSAGVRVRSVPDHAPARWQLLPASAGAVPGAQTKHVWHGVLCALVGDV